MLIADRRVTMARPRRLPDYSYTGLGSFFLTFCTYQRTEIFFAADVVENVLSHLLQAASEEGVCIVAYCFMPDHLHMLVVSERETADMVAFAKMAKQRSGYAFKQQHKSTLWQSGYVDRVLRNGEAMATVARYILENPIRANLVSHIEEYPFWGSGLWTRGELLQVIAAA
jgi:REP-associated tyrosine transposase